MRQAETDDENNGLQGVTARAAREVSCESKTEKAGEKFACASSLQMHARAHQFREAQLAYDGGGDNAENTTNFQD